VKEAFTKLQVPSSKEAASSNYQRPNFQRVIDHSSGQASLALLARNLDFGARLELETWCLELLPQALALHFLRCALRHNGLSLKLTQRGGGEKIPRT
jgi:hypothetical protein